MENDENFPLDDAAIEALADIADQGRSLQVAQNAILNYFLRQHKLTGNWTLAQNRRELVKQAAPVMATR